MTDDKDALIVVLREALEAINQDANNHAEAHYEAAQQASVERRKEDDLHQCNLSRNWSNIGVKCHKALALTPAEAAKELRAEVLEEVLSALKAAGEPQAYYVIRALKDMPS